MIKYINIFKIWFAFIIFAVGFGTNGSINVNNVTFSWYIGRRNPLRFCRKALQNGRYRETNRDSFIRPFITISKVFKSKYQKTKIELVRVFDNVWQLQSSYGSCFTKYFTRNYL